MADYRSITPAQEQELTIKRMIGNCNICKPCYITKVIDGNLVNVQATETIKLSTGHEVNYTEFPEIENVPVIFPYAQTQGFSLTVPLNAGDTGLLVFSDKALDNFLETGRPSHLPIFGDDALNACRSHSLTDAIFIPGMCWQGNRINSWASDCVEIRDANREHRASVKNDKVEILAGSDCSAVIEDSQITLKKGSTTVVITGGSIAITASGGGITFNGGTASMSMNNSGIALTGNLSVTGNITTSGNISASGTVHGSNI